MAILEAHFYSPALTQQVSMTVLLPERGRGPYPVLYLLHGYFGHHADWLHYSRIADYARRWPLIVAMPAGFNGFYTDHHAGLPFERYIVEDVIGFVERSFPVRRKREGRSLSGLSMGGYGALRLGFSHPNLFTSISCHSGAPQAWPKPQEYAKDAQRQRVFGPDPTGGKDDVTALAQNAKKRKGKLPQLHLDCGRSDAALATNRKFHRQLRGLNIQHSYREHVGSHSWEYWDARLPDALRFHGLSLNISSWK